MSHDRKVKDLLEEIRRKPHQRRPESASVSVYDSEGHWLFEVYLPPGAVVKTEDNERMREALQEIRDVAACSEGVEFYVMIADRGLGNAV
jgi:hypothetical protein